jgi:hypothetical protein
MEKRENPNIITIQGKEYKRAAPGKAPEWL